MQSQKDSSRVNIFCLFQNIGSGALVTAFLQNSSAVSLMVLAFVGAGVMNMPNAIGVIMGSNIGTTLTAWIIATIGFKIKIESLALPFIGLGAVGLILFKPSFKPFLVTRLLIGFGFLFLGLLSRLLVRIYPDYKVVLTVYLDQTPSEITDAATTALRKEIGHLLQECQLYCLRLLRIDDKLVFDSDLPLENNRRRKYSIDELYENIKLLHAEIFTFYSKIQEMEIASLLLANRLFTQSCRMQIYGMKDLLLVQEQINDFDSAIDAKEGLDLAGRRKKN